MSARIGSADTRAGEPELLQHAEGIEFAALLGNDAGDGTEHVDPAGGEAAPGGRVAEEISGVRAAGGGGHDGRVAAGEEKLEVDGKVRE